MALNTLPSLAALFGTNMGPKGIGMPLYARPNGAADDDEEDTPGAAVKPVAPVAPVAAPGAAPASNARGNILAMLPSALKAQQDAAAKQAAQGGGLFGGLGGTLADAADAGAGKSKIGAFASGFAHGLKSSQAYDDARAAGGTKAANDALDRLGKLFDITSKSDTIAETARHNAATEDKDNPETTRHNMATEANAATATSNLGKYYESIAAKNNQAAAAPNLSGHQGYAMDVAEMKKTSKYDSSDTFGDPIEQERRRQEFIYLHRKGGYGDPPDAMVPTVKMSAGNANRAGPSWWERTFGGDTPAPAAPPSTTVPSTLPGGGGNLSRLPDSAVAPATPAPPTAPAAPNPAAAGVIAKAQAAIAAGADPAAVKARLKAAGIEADF